MIIDARKVRSQEDFFEYLSGYMADGDKLTCTELDDGTLEFILISPCGYALLKYNEKYGCVPLN